VVKSVPDHLFPFFPAQKRETGGLAPIIVERSPNVGEHNMRGVIVRNAQEGDFDAIAELTTRVFIGEGFSEPEAEARLSDVRSRAACADLLLASFCLETAEFSGRLTVGAVYDRAYLVDCRTVRGHRPRLQPRLRALDASFETETS
jgi:hypothetical protein